MVVKVGNETRMTRLLTLAAEAELIKRETPERPGMLQVDRADIGAR